MMSNICKSGVGEAHKREAHSLKKLDDMSYESPACSIDGWSSESSSTANQSSNCLEVSFHTSTSRGACLGNDATKALNFQSFPHDESFDDQESHQTRFPNLCLEVIRGTVNDLSKLTRNFKPSGLRMPSPRIGFFDEDKAMMSTVGGDFLFHFGAQCPLPNISGVVIELEGKRGCSHSHLGDNFAENDRAPIYSSSFSKEYLFPRQQVSPNMLSKTGPLSLSTTVEFMPSTRTPLADKNSAPMKQQINSGL